MAISSQSAAAALTVDFTLSSDSSGSEDSMRNSAAATVWRCKDNVRRLNDIVDRKEIRQAAVFSYVVNGAVAQSTSARRPAPPVGTTDAVG